MAREQVAFKVGETSYRVTQFGASQGRSILLLLAKVASATFEGAAPGGSLKALADADFASAMKAFFESVDDVKLDRVCREFAAVCEFDAGGDRWPVLGTGTFFDDHFAGKYQNLVGWLFECIKANFAGFFDEYASKAGAVLGTKPQTVMTPPGENFPRK